MVLEHRLLPTWRSILGIALPSSAMNVAAPLLVTGQSMLLGHSPQGAIALAAYGSVVTTVSLATRVSSFLCDASSANVGASIGERNWAKLARGIQTSILYAVALGLLSVILLTGLKPVVFGRILRLDGPVLVASTQYFLLAVMKVPFTLVGLVMNGVLQGIRQNNALAGTAACFSLLEFVLDWSAVRLATNLCPGRSLLWKFGVIGIVMQALQTTATGVMLLRLKPVEADEGFSLYRELITEDVASDASEVENDGFGFALKSGMTHMLARSLIMQSTFAIALLCVSRLPEPTSALAAHHVISNVWMLISYFVDGLSAASIVLGTRLRAQADPGALTTLNVRCLAAGLIVGLVVMLGLLLGEDAVIKFYIGDASGATRALLMGAWPLVAAAQPLNGPLFVIDGILCGGQDYSFISRAYAVGFLLVFLPLIVSPLRLSLMGIWGTKAGFNVYRCAAALLWVKGDMDKYNVFNG